jgi:hypothetical protein
LKSVLPFLGGGLAGALVNEWLRRRNSKVQPIPLIERVNRLVSPQLKGITLARVTGAPENRRIEEIENLREYQLTLRNTSTIHLQDVEIQFEFPTEDVEAWASRPALSKTAPVPVDATATDPWKKAFRWRIPNLPSTDSIEFSFRAVNPPSDDYEVALYKTGRVVIERSKGEPSARRAFGETLLGRLRVLAASTAIVGVLVLFLLAVELREGDNVTIVNEGGCALTVISSFDLLDPSGRRSWSGPWQISYRLLNTGARKCFVDSEQLGAASEISPGGELKRTTFSSSWPKLIQRDLLFGTESPAQKTKVAVYGEARWR